MLCKSQTFLKLFDDRDSVKRAQTINGSLANPSADLTIDMRTLYFLGTSGNAGLIVSQAHVHFSVKYSLVT